MQQVEQQPNSVDFIRIALDQEQIQSHRFYGQVRLDVERTLKRFPPSNNQCNERYL